MYIIGQRETRTTTSSMPEIATDPQRVNLHCDRRFQQLQQGPRPARRSIINVIHSASIGVGVENILESQLSERAYKLPRPHDLLPFSGMYSTVRLDRSPTMMPPLLL